jgi:hypothetical protein
VIPPFDEDGDLPPGIHRANWEQFHHRFCIFARSDRRLRLCDQIQQMAEQARASGIVERLIFGGSFITATQEPNDFDVLIILRPGTKASRVRPVDRWLVYGRLARRAFGGDIFPITEGSAGLNEAVEFFSRSRSGKEVGVVEVIL